MAAIRRHRTAFLRTEMGPGTEGESAARAEAGWVRFGGVAHGHTMTRPGLLGRMVSE